MWSDFLQTNLYVKLTIFSLQCFFNNLIIIKITSYEHLVLNKQTTTRHVLDKMGGRADLIFTLFTKIDHCEWFLARNIHKKSPGVCGFNENRSDDHLWPYNIHWMDSTPWSYSEGSGGLHSWHTMELSSWSARAQNTQVEGTLFICMSNLE